MLTASVRVKGERDSWWEDVVRLLSGQGIRRSNPERVAIETAIRALRGALGGAAPHGGETAPIGLAISHDGAGPRRAVTAVAFVNPEAPRRPAGP